MVACKYCGKPVSEFASVCPNCGAELNGSADAVQTEAVEKKIKSISGKQAKKHLIMAVVICVLAVLSVVLGNFLRFGFGVGGAQQSFLVINVIFMIAAVLIIALGGFARGLNSLPNKLMPSIVAASAFLVRFIIGLVQISNTRKLWMEIVPDDSLAYMLKAYHFPTFNYINTILGGILFAVAVFAVWIALHEQKNKK